jgi:ferrous iron transport protein B
MTKKITIALAGNPNSGKSTVFNALTGARQHVGNWPGKTVEKKEGICTYEDFEIHVVDLPGTYSLTAYSMEEVIARDFILEGKPDMVVDIVDASNLERNLYLTVQLLELGANLVIDLNMMDMAEARDHKIDVRALSELLGVPVVPTVANKGQGIKELLAAIVSNASKVEMTAQETIARRLAIVDYGREIEEEISKLEKLISTVEALKARYPARWLAVKLLENDEEVRKKVEAVPGGAEVIRQAEASLSHLRAIFGDEAETVIADRRYGFISGLVKEVVRKPAIERLTTSDRIDKIVTNRLLGIPIFLAAMWLVFQMVTKASGPYSDWIDGLISGPITRWVVAILNLIGLGGTWVESLFVDGIIAGVGGVLVFVPVLLFLYFFLALLEDSGYMARAAFVMDRLMHTLGLHGRSFLPMLIGFGCTVPATYATRTLREEKDRLLTAQLLSLMSCGARLPVYTVFAAAFFAERAGWFIFGLYLFGIIMAIVMGQIFKRTLFAGPTPPFVMELPPYRLPTLKGILIHMWERTSYFLRKAAIIILAVSVILWFLMHIPWGVENMRDSLFGKASAAIAPVLAPAGCGNWEVAGSLVTGFVAKEMVVATMSQIYVGGAEKGEVGPPPTFLEDLKGIVVSFFNATVDTVKSIISIIPGVNLMGEEEEEAPELVQALREHFTPLQAVAFNVFVLLYIPCMAAMAAFRSEFGTKWALFNAGYLTALAWIVSTLVYQIGRLLGF